GACPVPSGQGQASAVEAYHLREEVAPGGRPQRGRHRAGGGIVLVMTGGQTGERSDAEGLRREVGAASRGRFGAIPFTGEALLVLRGGLLVGRATGGRVVRRRCGGHEGDPVG